MLYTLSRIDRAGGAFDDDEFYSDDEMVITISHLGYIKRTPLTEFRAQNRGGVGAKGSSTRKEVFFITPFFVQNTRLCELTNSELFSWRMLIYALTESPLSMLRRF